ncbi:dynein regulatory complex protein 1 isoform X2 [Zonotrichia leucophrys gambelii]|uniref:dynein regulatory complex protein 1 isoform X2 n=1 Tax=Zonotrichia leucophrys gambelii TaxID=257770 RepID=UPI0031405F28
MEPGADGAGPGPNVEPAEPEPEPELDPKRRPEPDPGADPGTHPGAGAGTDPGAGPGPDSTPGRDSAPAPAPGPAPGAVPDAGSRAGSRADWQLQQRIAARRSRIDARRREALGEKVEQDEEQAEEEQKGKSLKLVEETERALAKLLFHGTQLLTNVQVESDLRESQRREKDRQDKRARLEQLEADARLGTQRLEEIGSRWGLAGELRAPQELWELLELQRRECQQLLARKNLLIQELQEELKARDELYEQTLREQDEATRVLLERMEEQTRSMLKSYRHHLRHIEKTFEEERREMLTSNRNRWNEAMRLHNEQELEFLRRKVEQALDFEQQLNELQDASTETHDGLKWQLEEDVELLERKLRQMKGLHHLNQVKLDYNLDVLRQLDIENSTLRSLQKRKINRFRTTLELLKARMAQQEVKFQEEKQSLELELERVVGQFQETRDRMRHLARSRTERFRRVWMANEEEAKALIRKVLEADRLLHEQQLGIPWEEPRLWFMDNVGPLGDIQEKREAMELASKLLEGSKPGKAEQEGRKSGRKGAQSAEGGKEKQEKRDDRITSRPGIPSKTLRRILEVMSEESTFLLENKLLKPLREVVGPKNDVQQLRNIFEALHIEDEDELRALVDFFLDYETHHAPKIPVEDPAGRSRSHSQHGSLSHIPVIQVDHVLKILREFLQEFPKLRDEGPPRELQDTRDNSKDREYWEAMTQIIPQRKLKLWDALGSALVEYHKVLTRRSQLFSEATALQQQNTELGMLLEEYLGSTQG